MESGGTGKGGFGGPSRSIWEVDNWSAADAVPSSSTASLTYSAPSYVTSSSSSSSNALSCFPFPNHSLVSQGDAGGGRYQLLDYSRSQQQYHHHLTCLKLGKRPYYEEGMGVGVGVKRVAVGGAGTGVVPSCQVEGCGKPLGDAKEYHRRHKVCEAHSKAPKVVVLGVEQRFCQQCSRFHVISEFDDSKRSCRRRLAGHNERRRKSANDSNLRKPSLESTMMGGKFPYASSPSPGCALSLLSSKASPWVPSSDLSSWSSAALYELIAENRAAVLARQLLSDRGWYSMPPESQAVVPCMPHQNPAPSHAAVQLADGWNQTQVTLDLMQTAGSSLEMLPGRSESKDEQEECCEIWKSMEGTDVV